MPFSPPDTIYNYQTLLVLPTPQIEITLAIFYSMTEAQKDDKTCPSHRMEPAVCDPREADFRVHALALYVIAFQKMEELLELGGFLLLVSRV